MNLNKYKTKARALLNGVHGVTRIEKMIEHWNKHHWASSHIENDDNLFFTSIGKDPFEVATTSFTGADIIYYDHNKVIPRSGSLVPIEEFEMRTNANIETLRLAVNKALHNCLRTATPNICAMAETKDGYEEVERQILRMCLNEGITPAAAIALLESEYTNAE